MKTVAIAAIILSLAVGSVAPAWAQAPEVPGAAQPAGGGETLIKGKVDAVTVYRGEALVTRAIPLPAGAGLGEIVVSDLPERIVPASLFAEAAPGGPDGVEVRSVRYRERPVGQDVREEVRKLDDQIRQLNDQLAAISKQQQLLQEQRTYLDKLENFAAPTATVEMTKGVLNAEQLKALTTYQFDQRKAIVDQELKLQQDQRKANDDLSLVQRQRSDVTGRSSRTVREAVVFVSRKAGGTLRLRYLVDGASWSPSYNIRADAARKNATVEYQASIQQMSGEDWSDVSMTLSTATPNLVAAAPGLNPLSIALVSRSSGAAQQAGGPQYDYQAGKKQLYEYQQKAEANRGNNTYNGGTSTFANSTLTVNNFNDDNDRALNKVAEQLQVLELLASDGGAGGKRDDADRRAIATEGIVVTYEMRTRTSLPSRSDQQLVQIDSLPMKSDFYKVAIPLLTSYVYDEASLVNTSKIVLLAGPTASYVGGQFVGNGAVPTVAVGQPFTVGFGIDSALRATRERADRTETTQGGNKVVNYTFRLAIDNYGTAPANVRLLDRLPTAKDSEVRVAFVDAENLPLSKDKDYLQTQRKNGILRWDVQVPAEKNGTDAFSLTYKMNMEYDRNLAISSGSVMPSQDLEKLIDQRK